LWVKPQTAAVEEDRRFETLAVSEAAWMAFDCHDFAVHSLP
jgi:hypothetical protein